MDRRGVWEGFEGWIDNGGFGGNLRGERGGDVGTGVTGVRGGVEVREVSPLGGVRRRRYEAMGMPGAWEGEFGDENEEEEEEEEEEDEEEEEREYEDEGEDEEMRDVEIDPLGATW